MHEAHQLELGAIDLNLLVVLDALLAERHVTRAAARVGLTQSAASHALSRLRGLLGDPLLIRGPAGAMLPTARAEALAPALRAALATLQSALRGEAPFDPATARRTFRIATTDYAELILLPPLVEVLARDAPGCDLWVHAIPDDPSVPLASGTVDCAIGVWRGRGWPAGIYERKLFDDAFTCVVRRGHPAARQRLTLARYQAMSHLLIAPRSTTGSLVDGALAAIGRSRRVAVAVPHFLVAPHVIATSDLIVTLATRIARAFIEPLGLVALAPPLELPGFAISMVWHERSQLDPGQRWLRDRISSVSAALP